MLHYYLDSLGPVVKNFVSLKSSLDLNSLSKCRLHKQLHCNYSVFVIFTFEILTNRKLTISLILNNSGFHL